MTNITMIPGAERRLIEEARRQRMIREERLAHFAAVATVLITVATWALVVFIL